MNNGKTRLKMALLMIGLALVEGIIKHFLSGFPITEVFSIQGVAFGGYVGARTVSNMNKAKYDVAAK